MKTSTKLTIVKALFMWAGLFIIATVDWRLILGISLFYIGDQIKEN